MLSSIPNTYPRLLADIGGTNARFALQQANQKIEKIEVLACKDYLTISDAVRAYLQKVGCDEVKHAGIAIANPIVGDWVQMTNHYWAFSIEAVRQELGFETFILLNDFTAQALAITQMQDTDWQQIGGKTPDVHAPKAVLGPGTGLGVSGLIPTGRGDFVALAGEGGHVSFSPFNEQESQIWQYAQRQYGHVSAERLLSGAGLTMIYEALAEQAQASIRTLPPEMITQQALNASNELCQQTLEVFCAVLGTVSADLALTLGARGGVYLCGGILPRLGDYFYTSSFRQRFEDKGRFSSYLADIPVYLVLANHSGIEGAAVGLENALRVKMQTAQ